MRGALTVILLAFGLLLSPVFAGEDPPHAGAEMKTPAAKQRARREQVDRLMKMSPRQRQSVLARVPPARRQNIEKQIGELEKLPPATVDRIRTRQELLNAFPPQRQNQIRRSVRQFINMPEERRGALNRELQRMAPLPDDERRAYMNTEEFRNRYTANEQQMMLNLIAITPPAQPKD